MSYPTETINYMIYTFFLTLLLMSEFFVIAILREDVIIQLKPWTRVRSRLNKLIIVLIRLTKLIHKKNVLRLNKTLW